jgi:hypothetical protein
MRQWCAVRRSDKTLLLPAQAMLEFLGEERSNYLTAAQFVRSERSVSVSGL